MRPDHKQKDSELTFAGEPNSDIMPVINGKPRKNKQIEQEIKQLRI